MIQLGGKTFTLPTRWGFIMNKISDIVNGQEFIAMRDNKESEKDLDASTVLTVNRLFNFFEANCPGYDKQYKGNESKLKMQKINFARGLMEAGINQIEQLEVAIKKCRRESPINTPTVGQFLNWCKPSADDLGLLTKEQAYNSAYKLMRDGDIGAMSEVQFNILQHAINESDRHFLKNNIMEKTQPVFYRNYEISVRDYTSGKLKEIPKALEDKNAEAKEIEKQNEIKKGFENLKGYSENMAWMKKLLGGDFGTSDSR
jgi:hypothetical protein